MPEELIGKVSDFFTRPVVAAVELTGALKVGDTIHFKGHTTDMELVVSSMQINNANILQAKAGDAVGIKITGPVRKGDDVYIIS